MCAKEREKINEGGACRLIRNDVSVFRHINFQSGFFFHFSSFFSDIHIYFFLPRQFMSLCSLPKWNELECGAKYGNLVFHMILATERSESFKKKIILCVCEWGEKRKEVEQEERKYSLWKGNKGKSIYNVGRELIRRRLDACVSANKSIRLCQSSSKDLWQKISSYVLNSS